MARSSDVLTLTDRGLYCPVGDFYVDPWRPVDRAIVTHAHSDHARWGMGHYLCASDGIGVLRRRVGEAADIHGVPYGEVKTMNGVKVSLHPAGHILGSAQVRIEHDGFTAVVSGDYKTSPEPTCAPFEPLPCHLFVTESTFGLPIYQWSAEADIREDIHGWWRSNQAAGKASILMGYALGKAQRALAMLDPETGPIFLHGAVHSLTQDYRRAGVALPPTELVFDKPRDYPWQRAILIAPPSVNGSTWLRRFGDVSLAFLSGWMSIRGARRRRAVDRGFVLSDHADWAGLHGAIRETGAEEVWVTHGYTAPMVRYLNEQGLLAKVLRTQFEGEQDEAASDATDEEGDDRGDEESGE